jgi:hypothetical protein
MIPQAMKVKSNRAQRSKIPHIFIFNRREWILQLLRGGVVAAERETILGVGVPRGSQGRGTKHE